MKKFILSILLQFFLLQSTTAFAADAAVTVAKDTVVSGAAGEAKGAVASKVGESTGIGDKISNFLDSPPGIMIVAGIGGLNAGMLYSAAADQEKECEDNIKKIDTILASFTDSFSNFCPNGREKLEEPSCYCYLETGKQNPDRSNSQICQELWKKNLYVYDTTQGAYAGAPVNDPVGCLRIDGQFDEECQCKKMLNSAGQNACLKTVSVNVSGNPLGAAYIKASGVDQVMSNLANTASGNSNIGNLSERTLGLAIAKAGNINNGLLGKLAKDPNRKMFPQLNSNDDLNKYSGAIFTKRDLAAAGGGSLLASISSGSLSPAATKAINEVKKKTGLQLSGGNGINVAKEGKKAEMNFNFMDAPAGGGQGGQVVGNFPDKNYKYKNSDIVTDQGASIFEIISNRYVESGLKRLFEEPSEVKKNK